MSLAPEAVAPARVFVVGKDPLVTRALTRLLQLDSAVDVLGDAPSLGRAPIADLRPDVVVLDTDGQPLDLPSTRAYLARLAPETTVATLASLRDLTVGELLDTVKGLVPTATHEQRRHLRPVDAELPPPSKHTVSTLSERELEVVRLVAEGLSNKEISSRLNLSDKTVKNHISHILAKMNLTARTQVAVYAIRAGIV